MNLYECKEQGVQVKRHHDFERLSRFLFPWFEVQVLPCGAYRPTDFKCEITLFFGHKKRPGNGFSVMAQIKDLEKYIMIELLIKDVILYKDRIEIHFNYTDLIRPDAEKRRAFLFYKFSKDVVMKRKSNLPLEKKTIRFEMYA